MCRICIWIETLNLFKEPMTLKVPSPGVSLFSRYESDLFKVKYCPACGRRLKKKKNGGKDNDN